MQCLTLRGGRDGRWVGGGGEGRRERERIIGLEGRTERELSMAIRVKEEVGEEWMGKEREVGVKVEETDR